MRHDYSILNKFGFKIKPVGVKFLLNRLEGIEVIDRNLPLCETLKEAQERRAFCIDEQHMTCMGPVLLGMRDPDPIFASGHVGAKEGIYEEPRANRRIYQAIPRLGKGTVRYVALACLDDLPFEPDVLVIAAELDQAEVILRAASYSTGRPLTSRITPVLSCAWILVYPYVTGELNYTVTGIGYGMKAKKLFPEGRFLISLPFDLIPMVLENLRNMEWVPRLYTLDEAARKQFAEELLTELREEYLRG
ncbi:MAG: DUF169 domain-containing protein [Clostridia bacterium]|jgi:uncharacterized protein (DUF169 family)|nr:DUF169 domain-containing protein [Clostridia bacterium]MDH7573529.1 DUF169 domain-containing protein [Clostridia bacterium]